MNEIVDTIDFSQIEIAKNVVEGNGLTLSMFPPVWLLFIPGIGWLVWLIIIICDGPSYDPPTFHITKNLSLLGMKGAGKTTFLNWLKYKEFRLSTTETIQDEINIYFEGLNLKGYDISGDKSFIRKYYNEKMLSADIILFFFNGTLFLENKNERKEILDRIDFIKTKTQDSINTKKFAIIATHFDKANCKYVDDFRTQIMELCSKDVKDFVFNNIIISDLTSKEYVNKILKQVFDKTI